MNVTLTHVDGRQRHFPDVDSTSIRESLIRLHYNSGDLLDSLLKDEEHSSQTFSLSGNQYVSVHIQFGEGGA